MLTLTLQHDPDLDCPCELDGWRVNSFCRRHVAFTNPSDLGLGHLEPSTGMPKVTNPGLRPKLRQGLAFFLSYYEHGNCIWFLHGEEPAGVEFRWDGVRVAGLLVWDWKPGDLGPKTLEERRRDAATFLKAYTSWANGEGYGYSIEDEAGQVIDSCFGFNGADLDGMLQQIRECLSDRACDVRGDAAWLANNRL